ncbi:hypothetical protein [Acinetobacter bohemicus]|uniref:hypothetical protein n=1 Tax=Acinetobacter bohemicus TaxID=1435036 RepID=UPI004041D81C
MKIQTLILLLPFSLLTFAHGEEYGTYYNGNTKVKIFYDMGGRGGDEFSSSICPKKVFKPQYVSDLFWLQETKKNQKTYAISINPARMTIESNEKCLPEGNYKKISNDIQK